MAGGLSCSVCGLLHVVSLLGLVWASSQDGGWFPRARGPRENEKQVEVVMRLSPGLGSLARSLLPPSTC